MRRRAARNQQNQQNVRDDAGLALLRNANEAQAADLEIQIPDDLRSNADSLNSEGATIHSDLSGSDDSQSGSAMEDGGADEDDANDLDMDNEEMDGIPEKIPDLEESLYPGGDCSKFECLLMILSFSRRHGLSQVAMLDLCTMMNHILRGNYLPTGEKILRKIFRRSKFVNYVDTGF